VKYFVGAVPDLKGVKTRHGDYVNESLSRILLHQEYLVNVVQSYQRHAPGKSMIVFAVNVAHSQAIVDRYRDAGIRAAHLDGNTPKAERERLLAHFTANEIQVLSNCEIITEGFDFPACEVVQLTRPTKSLTLYLQSVGRVMRPAAGKSSGMILDNAGCWLEHGFATMDREWTLEGVEKQHTQLVGRDPEGTVHDVQRTPPDELQGLELLEATEELQRLLVFETFLHEAQRWNHKVISAYFRYLEYLDATGDVLSTQEFEYLKRRLNRVNSSVDAAKRFNPRFWVVQEKRYQRTNYARQVLSYGQTRPTVEVEVQWA
jgi:superfamily II DNA or RNA helicase